MPVYQTVYMRTHSGCTADAMHSAAVSSKQEPRTYNQYLNPYLYLYPPQTHRKPRGIRLSARCDGKTFAQISSEFRPETMARPGYSVCLDAAQGASAPWVLKLGTDAGQDRDIVRGGHAG